PARILLPSLGPDSSNSLLWSVSMSIIKRFTEETVCGQLGDIADWKKDTDVYTPLGFMNLDEIKERMPVYASCGCRVGTVDHVEGGGIKLARNDSPDGRHHFIPSIWVDHVDDKVYLNKDANETRQEWDM
ncbi:MAG TPA: DUF2171 domain-containing protein, partial [Urbifossiella sp.]